ncbi:MAG: 2-oxo acid dehydrogenase subunit E2 [Candidatus Aenigmarchaeota archaeon]|nr:2-oxo acid dehydrogenase subunit E2 [Candidatus Aenigmarchaeota archaeon]
MAKEFKFPDVGEGITEGEIVKWFVKVGDEIKEHQALGEIETDKAIVEMPSPYSGVVLKIAIKEGETVKVGEILVVIGEKGEVAKETVKQPEVKPAGVVGYLEEAPEEEKVETKPSPKQETEHVEVLATPAVRKLAKELNIDLPKIKGSGAGGRILEDDVKKATKEAKEPELKIMKKYDMWGYIDRIPLKGIRKIISEHMTKSAFTAPHVTHFDEIDVTKLAEYREKEKKVAEMKGIKLTYLPFVIKAVIAGLKQYPRINASLEEGNETIIVKKYYNIGIAVDTDAGLMVPVIKGADQKSIYDIAREANELAEKCRNRTIDLMDLKGGSFTLTNIGSLGGIFATPIINYPEVAILMTGKMFEKLMLEGDKIKVKKIMPLSLSFDHRVIDGADAARFVNTVKQYLENPEMILAERN